MKAKLRGTLQITLIAETSYDGVLIERLRRKYIGGPDPAWPQGIPCKGLSGAELMQWINAQEKAGRNPLLMDQPVEI